MKNIRLFPLLFLLLFMNVALSAQTAHFIPAEDVYISEQNPLTNFNTQGLVLSVQNTGTSVVRTDICLKFNMTTTFSSVISNQLSLAPDLSIATPNIDSVYVYIMTGPWSEDTLTWSGAQALTGFLIGEYAMPGVGSIIINLPDSIIQSWSDNPATNYGIRIAVKGQPVSVQQAFCFDKENPDIQQLPLLNVLCSLTGPPTAPLAILYSDTVCFYPSGGTALFSAFPATFNSIYNWILPSGWNIGMNMGSDISVDVTTSNSGYVCVYNSNSNGNSDTVCKYVTVVTPGLMPGTISGPGGSVCGGDTLTFTLTPLTTDSSWEWTVPGGWTILSGQGTTSINVVCALNNYVGTIYVAVDNFCNGGQHAYYTQYVTIAPPAPTISGQQVVFPNSAVQYIVYTQMATSYIWSVPPGASIITNDPGNQNITVLYGTASGLLCVQGINDCAMGSTICWPINVTTGIEEAFTEPGIQIANVDRGIISIHNLAGIARECEVFSISGAVVTERFNLAAQSEFRLQLKPGLYFIRCVSGSFCRTYKVCAM